MVLFVLQINGAILIKFTLFLYANGYKYISKHFYTYRHIHINTYLPYIYTYMSTHRDVYVNYHVQVSA